MAASVYRNLSLSGNTFTGNRVGFIQVLYADVACMVKLQMILDV